MSSGGVDAGVGYREFAGLYGVFRFGWRAEPSDTTLHLVAMGEHLPGIIITAVFPQPNERIDENAQ